MSGTLERMVARARGVLPVVRPLATPLPPGPNPGSVELREAAVSANHPLVEPATRRIGDPAIRDPRAVRAHEPDPHGRQAPAEKTDSTMNTVPGNPISVDMDSFPSRGTDGGEPGSVGSEPPPGFAGTVDRSDPPQDPVGRHFPTTAAEDPPMGERRMATTWNVDDDSDRTWSVGESQPVQARPFARGTRHRTGSKPHPAPEPETEPPPRTEIHVSIGTIELRSAKPEPRPVAPAFRPRVSLEDFLGRRGTGR